MTSKVSFTVRRPPTTESHHTPSQPHSGSQSASFVSRPDDSSDDEEHENATEFVTGFDRNGAQRLHERPRPSKPLVIAPLANRDWRAVARSQKQRRFIPDGAMAPTGKDGSQGGLGTTDTINSGPQAAGLVTLKKVASAGINESAVKLPSEEVVAKAETLEESEDERARKALLASAGGSGEDLDETAITTIPVGDNQFTRFPMDETDAYKQDVVTRPDSATLEDYERVPVSQFGAALLRGMGWKEGTAASRTRQGLVEPWLPASRPALLGLGAKERPSEDIPASGKVSKRPEKRYVPLVKLEKERTSRPPPSRSRSRSPTRSGTASRIGSKTSSPYPSDKERRSKHRSRDKDLDDRRYEKASRERDRDRRDRVQDISRSGGRDERADVHRDMGHQRDRDRDHEEQSRRGRDYKRDGHERGVRS